VSAFRKYTREELAKFVRSMDRVIDEPTEILVIGGAAAALKYGATASTKDIDTWHAVPRAVAKAAADARAETGSEAARRVPSKRKPGAGGMRV